MIERCAPGAVGYSVRQTPRCWELKQLTSSLDWKTKMMMMMIRKKKKAETNDRSGTEKGYVPIPRLDDWVLFFLSFHSSLRFSPFYPLPGKERILCALMLERRKGTLCTGMSSKLLIRTERSGGIRGRPVCKAEYANFSSLNDCRHIVRICTVTRNRFRKYGGVRLFMPYYAIVVRHMHLARKVCSKGASSLVAPDVWPCGCFRVPRACNARQ